MKTLTTLLFFILSLPQIIYAQAGDPDITFNTTGFATMAIGPGDDNGNAVALQEDGKIVVAGESFNGADFDVAVARFNSDGTVDNSFGNGGHVSADLGHIYDTGKSVAIQSDGKILVAGYFFSNAGGVKICLLRFNNDGTPDVNFGTNGIDSLTVNNSATEANGMALQADGKIVLAGSSNNGNNLDFTLLRFNSDGSPDNTFGTAGIVTTGIGNSDDYANAVIIQSDGKIVAVGKSGTSPDIAAARYNADGTLDNTFSGDGKVTTNVNGNDNAFAVAIDSNGNVVVCGEAFDGLSYDISIVRYTAAGTPDNTFSSDGKTTVALGSTYDGGYSIAVQADGKILVAGKTSTTSNGDNVALIRLKDDGTLDSSFGNNGKVSTDFNGSGDAALGLALQPDGKIVVAGYSGNGSNNDFLVARYISGLNVGVADIQTENHSLLLYPNPIHHEATFSYTLVRDDHVSLQVEDITGRILHTYLANASRSAGQHEEKIVLPPSCLPGNYVLRLITGEGSAAVKITAQ